MTDDSMAFARLLSRCKKTTKKTFLELREIIGVKDIHGWHDGKSFPEQERLLSISLAYDVDLDLVVRIYKLAKAARAQEGRAGNTSLARSSRVIIEHSLPANQQVESTDWVVSGFGYNSARGGST